MASSSAQTFFGKTASSVRVFKYSQSFTSSQWTLSHGFSSTNLIFQFYDQNNIEIFPTAVATTSSSALVSWAVPMAGSAIVVAADAPNSFVYTQTPASTSWNINHSLNSANVLYQFYDQNGNVIFPSSVKQYNNNTLGATFTTAQPGKAIVFAVDFRYVNAVTTAYTQLTASNSWAVYHQANTPLPFVYVYDVNGFRLAPSSIDVTNNSFAIVNFATPQLGTAYVSGVFLPSESSTGTTGTGFDTNAATYNSFLYHNITASSFTVSHQLNDIKPLFQIYDPSGNIILVDSVIATDANTLTVTLFSTQECYVRVASVGGPSKYNYVQSAPIKNWKIQHNLNDSYPLVQIYDSNNKLIVPDQVVSNTNGIVTVLFKTNQAGFATVVSIPQNLTTLRTYLFNQPTASTTWNVVHGLSDLFPIVSIYAVNNNRFVPDAAFAFDPNSISIGLLVADSGYVRVLGVPSGASPPNVLFDPRDPRVQNKFRSIVPAIAEEFPAFVRGFSDNSTVAGTNILVTFIEAYYEWLEQEMSNTTLDTNIQYLINNSDILFDVDYGVKKYLSHYKFQYLNQIPYLFSNDTSIQLNSANLNPSTLIKLIRSFYKAKGAQKSIKFLFNFLFSDPTASISLYSPRLLTDPAVTQNTVRYIRTPFNLYLSNNDLYKALLGRIIFGRSSGSRARVQSLTIIQEGPYPVLEIEISQQIGVYSFGEILETRDAKPTISFTPYILAGSVTITQPGTGYVANRSITVTSLGSMQSFSATIQSVSGPDASATPPTSAKLIGGSLTPVQTSIAAWRTYTNGGVSFGIDGGSRGLNGLDFSAVVDLNGVASIVNANIKQPSNITFPVPTGTFIYNSGLNRFELTSDSTGSGSSVTFATAGVGQSIDISSMLGMRSTSSGAYTTQGSSGAPAVGAITSINLVDPGIDTSNGIAPMAPTVTLADQGNGDAAVMVGLTIEYNRQSLSPRYNGLPQNIPIQPTIPVFTSYNSRYSNLKNGTVPRTRTAQIRDSGPNNLNGVIIGDSVLVPAISGAFANEFLFSGLWKGANTGGIIFGPNPILAPTTVWTLEARIYPTSRTSTLQIIAGKWSLLSSDSHFRIYLTAAGNVVVDAAAFGNFVVTVTSPTPVSLSAYHSIAGQWDGTALKLFVDGVLVGSSPLAKMQNPSLSGSFWIGRDDETPDPIGLTAPYEFSGRIDEVRISSIARYATNYTPSTIPLVSDSSTIFLSHMNAIEDTLNNKNTTVVLTAPIEYTYFIRSQVGIGQYRDILKSTVHPAGMKFFAIVDVNIGDTAADLARLDMFHTVHPTDANYSNPLYVSDRFFYVIDVSISPFAIASPQFANEFTTVQFSSFADSRKLGHAQPLNNVGPYKIDLYTSQTYPTGNNLLMPKTNSPDTNSPNRLGDASFGHLSYADFGIYTRSALTESTDKDATAVAFTPTFNSATNPNIRIDGFNLNSSNFAIASGSGKVRATVGYATGKIYWEFLIRGLPIPLTVNFLLGVGIAGATAPSSTGVGYDSNSFGLYANNNMYVGNSTSFPSNSVSGLYDVIRIAADFTNGKLYFGINQNWLDLSDPVAGVAPAVTFDKTQTYFAAVSPNFLGVSGTALLNQDSFFYSPPTGYTAYDPNINLQANLGLIPQSSSLIVQLTPSNIVSSQNTTGSSTVTTTSPIAVSSSGGTAPYTLSVSRITNLTDSGATIAFTTDNTSLVTFTSSSGPNSSDDKIASFRITTTDFYGNVGSSTISIEHRYVASSVPLSLVISPTSSSTAIPTDTAAQTFSNNVTATSSGGVVPYTVTVARLANGTTGGSGILPTVAGSGNTSTVTFTSSSGVNTINDRVASFRVTVTDSAGFIAFRDISIEHNYTSNALSFSFPINRYSSNIPQNGSARVLTNTVTFVASGGTPPYSFIKTTLSESPIPSGITSSNLNSSSTQIQFTSSSTAIKDIDRISTIAVKMTDSVGAFTTKNLTIEHNYTSNLPLFVLNSSAFSANIAATPGVARSFTNNVGFVATGGVAPYTFVVTRTTESPPAGSGIISNTVAPTDTQIQFSSSAAINTNIARSTSFHIVITDSVGSTTSQDVTVEHNYRASSDVYVLNSNQFSGNVPPNAGGARSYTNSIGLVTTGGTAPYTYTATNSGNITPDGSGITANPVGSSDTSISFTSSSPLNGELDRWAFFDVRRTDALGASRVQTIAIRHFYVSNKSFYVLGSNYLSHNIAADFNGGDDRTYGENVKFVTAGGVGPYTATITRLSNDTPGGAGITVGPAQVDNTGGSSIVPIISSGAANVTINRTATFRITRIDSLGFTTFNDITIEHNYL